MKFNKIILLALVISSSVAAGPVLQMNKAFNSLMDLMPYILNESKFHDKKNEKDISKAIKSMNDAFKLAGHNSLIKHDLFAPSYQLISENVKEIDQAFKKGKKDYALWMIKESVSTCLGCHTRLPQEHTSSFQDGDLTIDKNKLKTPYELGITYLIVRRYVDAKENFIRSIQDKIIKKDFSNIIHPFQQILLIELKIKKDPKAMITIVDDFIDKKNLPRETVNELSNWKKRLNIWKDEKALTTGLQDEKSLKRFINTRLEGIEEKSFEDSYKVDLLLASGILSNYFFHNTTSPSAPELNYWLGWIEKRLQKAEFMSSGDLFLKQCIRKYSKHPMAKKCLKEYQESVEFDFSGSSGTHIPEDIKKELELLQKMIRN